MLEIPPTILANLFYLDNELSKLHNLEPHPPCFGFWPFTHVMLVSRLADNHQPNHNGDDNANSTPP